MPASVRCLAPLAGLAVLLCAAPAASASGRSTGATHAPLTTSVVGGSTAPDGSWPSAAFVIARAGDGRAYSCTGSVIAPTAVVTAAHCAIDPATDKPFAPAALEVVTGVHDLRGAQAAGQTFTVAAVAVNPDFNESTLDDDAAVLTLPQPTAAPPIRLATPAEISGLPPGAPVSIAGWGQITDSQSELQQTLQQAQVLLESPDYCTQALQGFHPDTMLCTDVQDHGIGPCHGDSGGPLTIDTPTGPALIGLTDWGGQLCDESAAAYASMATVGFWVATAAGIAPPEGTSAPTPVERPRNLLRPFISGRPHPNGFLVCNEGRWTNTPQSFEYSWIYNGRRIPGVHSRTVQLSRNTHSGWAHCLVVAHNRGGRAVSQSRGLHLHR